MRINRPEIFKNHANQNCKIRTRVSKKEQRTSKRLYVHHSFYRFYTFVRIIKKPNYTRITPINNPPLSENWIKPIRRTIYTVLTQIQDRTQDGHSFKHSDEDSIYKEKLNLNTKQLRIDSANRLREYIRKTEIQGKIRPFNS